MRELRDPTAETVAEIVRVIRESSPIAAEAFVQLYLGDVAQGDRSPD
ncbi:hypothetical protein H6F67_22700 [Microcoleus sp. FACHB-1515]|nr:hypothetical protein [Microcoleus sp. FACHB-1515]MBD2092664.1 hypothetical protein [Microcoleus sp. FACHB-1515]